jgi:threonine dehydrogenase-like Zn-dependent dehydrogenase
MELAGGTGVDAALECIGIGQSVSTALSITRAIPEAGVA